MYTSIPGYMYGFREAPLDPKPSALNPKCLSDVGGLLQSRLSKAAGSKTWEFLSKDLNPLATETLCTSFRVLSFGISRSGV